MHESTLRLIPEPALRTPKSGLERPETALLAFGPEMAETWQLGRLLQSELEEDGIIYDSAPDHVPTLYAHGRGSGTLLGSKEVSELVLRGAWTGKDIADNLLKGMYWARLENKASGPLNFDQVRAIGSAVGAAYNTQYGRWREGDTHKSKHTILMHSYLDGHDRLLVRGGDANLEYNRDIIDARSSRRPGIDKPVTINHDSQNTEEIDVLAFHGQKPSKRVRLAGRLAAAASAMHL